MGIQNLSNDVLLATLPARPQAGGELGDVYATTSDCDTMDVIIDFANVVILSSAGICDLMLINEAQKLNRRQLILCNVSPQIRRIFARTAIEPMFRFADSEYEALQQIRESANSLI